jgi:hypothetical protein
MTNFKIFFLSYFIPGWGFFFFEKLFRGFSFYRNTTLY